jgi:hypothetical protein
MNRKYFISLSLALFCAASLLLMAAAASAGEFVRLSVTGTNVNLRPQPRMGGAVLAQASPKDGFIAEKGAFIAADGSRWYKILFTVGPSGNFRAAAGDSRFKGSPPYISAQFASAAPLSSGDEERAASLAGGSGETYAIDSKGKDTKVYRVTPGGERVEIEMPKGEDPAVTAKLGNTGGITWLRVDDRHEGMEDSRLGVYLFGENDNLLSFLPSEARPYAIIFAPDMKHALLLSQWDYRSYSSAVDLYGSAEKKASFGFLGGDVQWMDSDRFVFTMLEPDKTRAPRPGGEANKNWTSVAVMDTDGKLSRLMAATETKNYMFGDVYMDEKKLTIYETTVKDKKDWADTEKQNVEELTVPFPGK